MAISLTISIAVPSSHHLTLQTFCVKEDPAFYYSDANVALCIVNLVLIFISVEEEVPCGD